MENKRDFTQGNIFGKMLSFMMPILAALVLQALYGAVDLLIVGKFGTTAGISGVSTGSGIMNLFTFVLCSLASGVTILSGRYLGEKKNERIGTMIGSAVAFFIAFAVVCTVIMLVFARPLAILMQAPAEAVDLTVLYIRICGAGFIFVVFYNLISCIFRGMGNSNLPLLFVGIACVVNIILDLILVAALKMNVAGAALATVTAQAISVVLSLIIIRKQQLPFEFRKEFIRFGNEIKIMLGIGAPLALQDFLTNLSFLALCAFVNRLGLDASSGYGVAQKIQSFVMLIPAALMQCMASFVAQNVGAGKEDRARKGMFYGMLFGSVIGIFVGFFAFFKGDLAATLFTNDPLVIGRAFEYLKGFALEAVITCILFSYLGYFNGHAKSLFVMVQGLIQSFLIRLPIAYFMSIKPNASLTGIALAAPIATIIGIILCTIYYRKLQKTL